MLCNPPLENVGALSLISMMVMLTIAVTFCMTLLSCAGTMSDATTCKHVTNENSALTDHKDEHN